MNNFINNFMRWYTRNYVQIAWFIIGWLSMCTLVDFSKGDWSAVAFDLFLIFINYLFVHR
jgi:hypothetical protein